jgi:hypothetical protein
MSGHGVTRRDNGIGSMDRRLLGVPSGVGVSLSRTRGMGVNLAKEMSLLLMVDCGIQRGVSLVGMVERVLGMGVLSGVWAIDIMSSLSMVGSSRRMIIGMGSVVRGLLVVVLPKGCITGCKMMRRKTRMVVLHLTESV